jgi:hypothetical protein
MCSLLATPLWRLLCVCPAAAYAAVTDATMDEAEDWTLQFCVGFPDNAFLPARMSSSRPITKQSQD